MHFLPPKDMLPSISLCVSEEKEHNAGLEQHGGILGELLCKSWCQSAPTREICLDSRTRLMTGTTEICMFTKLISELKEAKHSLLLVDNISSESVSVCCSELRQNETASVSHTTHLTIYDTNHTFQIMLTSLLLHLYFYINKLHILYVNIYFKYCKYK